MYVYICKSYVYLRICGGHKRPSIIQNHNTNKIQKYYDYTYTGLLQSKCNLDVYAYICHPKFLTSPLLYKNSTKPILILHSFIPYLKRFLGVWCLFTDKLRANLILEQTNVCSLDILQVKKVISATIQPSRKTIVPKDVMFHENETLSQITHSGGE